LDDVIDVDKSASDGDMDEDSQGNDGWECYDRSAFPDDCDEASEDQFWESYNGYSTSIPALGAAGSSSMSETASTSAIATTSAAPAASTSVAAQTFYQLTREDTPPLEDEEDNSGFASNLLMASASFSTLSVNPWGSDRCYDID